MKKSKVVLPVRCKSNYGSEELLHLIHQHPEEFRNVPGLLQKYYLADGNSETGGGIYVFENKDARAAFWDSKLAKAIAVMYGVNMETPDDEELEVTIEMRETVAA